ncbi:MAG: hypothetical protein H6658_02805 [Ardenticatenaceae bacterium]|nr:hypothetical protein [Ardenticatenaceae bacterium]
MSNKKQKRIGLLIGREWDWPSAFMEAVNGSNKHVVAELIKLGSTNLDEPSLYDLIIDRMSHEVPYYRAFLQHAAIAGVDIINNPFLGQLDNRFLGQVVIHKFGFKTPRTVALPNKDVEREVVADSFRNLKYPLEWQEIIDYVGVPAIIKDIRTGGRRIVHRVNSVDELIQRYDESGTRTVIVQEVIESDTHVHCFVIGQEQVLVLYYSLEDGRYLPTSTIAHPQHDYFVSTALALTKAYAYDINMVEIVVEDDQPYVINSNNPAPIIDKTLMFPDQFQWCVDEIVALAIKRVKRPLRPRHLFHFDKTK